MPRPTVKLGQLFSLENGFPYGACSTLKPFLKLATMITLTFKAPSSLPARIYIASTQHFVGKGASENQSCGFLASTLHPLHVVLARNLYRR